MVALLAAISQIESGDNPRAIGKKGEVSQYQITKSVWKKHSPKVQFHAEKAPWVAQAVATLHLRELNMKLAPELRRTPSNNVYWLAVAWNGGLGAVQKAKAKGEYSSRHVPKHVQSYADRVRALYHVKETAIAAVNADHERRTNRKTAP